MLVAINQSGERVEAHRALKNENYVCPYCKTEVILRKGVKVVPHFAHKYNIHRLCAKGETDQHYYVKYCIANQLKLSGYKVEIEPFCPEIKQYPDVLVNSKHVIEVQFSRINYREIKARSKGFKQLHMSVIWIIEDCRYIKGTLFLNTFQAYFIHPMTRILYTWSNQKQSIIKYYEIQHIGGKRFYAKRTICDINHLFDNKASLYPHIYKLTNRQVSHYIHQCRRKDSVLEPTLSAMYQLRLTDEKTCTKFGYIFPEQLYIETHPVQWQLQLALLIQQRTDLQYQFKKLIRFRKFYIDCLSQEEITTRLINKFINKIYNS